jgi:hypothetical protein
MHNIHIVECDKAKIKVTVYSIIRVAKAMDDIGVVVPSEPVVAATANIGHEARGAKRRRAGTDGAKTRCQARVHAGDMLPSSKLQRPFKGTSSHLDYQEVLKVKASADAVKYKAAQESAAVGETPSINNAVKGMRAALAARNIEIARR